MSTRPAARRTQRTAARPRRRPASTPTVRERTLDVGDLHLPVLEAGTDDAPLVLLLHGFPQSAETWRPMLPGLAEAGWHVVAPHQRGYAAGARPVHRSDYHVDRLIEDVRGLADELGHHAFHLVGHDWGGLLGWVLAADHPEWLHSFTALATPHPAAFARALVGPQALRSSYVGFFQLPLLPEAVLGAGHNTVLRRMLERSGLSGSWASTYANGLDPAGLHGALHWYRAANPWSLGRVGKVSVPTQYLWGSHDAALGRAAAEGTAAHVVADYRFVEVDGPHWLPEERTSLVLDAVLDQLAHTQPSR